MGQELYLANTNIHSQIYVHYTFATNCAIFFQTIKHAMWIFDAFVSVSLQRSDFLLSSSLLSSCRLLCSLQVLRV